MSNGTRVLAFALVGCALAAGCRPTPHGNTQRLAVSSGDFRVSGEFQFVQLDRVDGLAKIDGRALLKGKPADLAIDLPAQADPARTTHHWALVTDAHVEGRRLVTFTHSESVKDLSAELPDGEAPLHFMEFGARSGATEVLVFATGDRASGAPCLYGFIAIEPQ